MRPIDADALLKKQTTICVTYHCQGADEWDDYEVVLVKDINNAPTISPDEVRGVGKWIWHDNYGWDDSLECSCCAEEFVVYDGEFPGIDSFKFCPNCGAKMEVSEDA